MLYEMVTAKAFSGPELTTVIYKIVNEEPVRHGRLILRFIRDQCDRHERW